MKFNKEKSNTKSSRKVDLKLGINIMFKVQ